MQVHARGTVGTPGNRSDSASHTHLYAISNRRNRQSSYINVDSPTTRIPPISENIPPKIRKGTKNRNIEACQKCTPLPISFSLNIYESVNYRKTVLFSEMWVLGDIRDHSVPSGENPRFSVLFRFKHLISLGGNPVPVQVRLPARMQRESILYSQKRHPKVPF